jgi:hypothetical protein
LNPGYVRTVAVPIHAGAHVAARARTALGEEAFELASEWKLHVTHSSKGRTYLRGTRIILSERNVRVDGSRNERGQRRAKLYLAGLIGSILSFVLLDVFYAASYWWVFPDAASLGAFLLLTMSAWGTSEFCSDVIAVAIPPAPEDGEAATEGPSTAAAVLVEISGSFARTANYSSKNGANGRTVKACAETQELRRAVDAITDRLGHPDRLRG